MIYLDASVALAHLLGETRTPPVALWEEHLVASRLLEYELWVRIHVRGLSRTHGDDVRALLSTVALVEMAPPVLLRVTEPFRVPVRTLDAIHLASLLYLREQGNPIRLATYDERMTQVARGAGVELAPL